MPEPNHGQGAELESIGSEPSRRRLLPHAAVVPEADVLVTHGGMGTTEHLAQAFRNAGGAERAVELLEGLLVQRDASSYRPDSRGRSAGRCSGKKPKRIDVARPQG